MKIHSKYRDYFDYLAKVYGEDPLINWERHMLTERWDSPIEDDRRYRQIDPHNFAQYYDYYSGSEWSNHWEQRIVVVAGKRFLVYRRSQFGRTQLRIAAEDNPWTALTADADILSVIAGNDHRPRWNQRKLKPESVMPYLGAYSDAAMELCVKYQSPVLWLNIGRSGVQVHAGCPRLSDIVHFAAAYPAEQIFQDISDFWLNRAAGSPDADPPVEVNDQCKIAAHGFDKTSFRPGMRRA